MKLLVNAILLAALIACASPQNTCQEPDAGTEGTALWSGTEIFTALAVYDGKIYGNGFDGVHAIPIDGSGEKTLLTTINSGTIAVDDGFVYLANGNDVVRVPRDGGSPLTVASNQALPSLFVVDSQALYWFNLDSQTLVSAPLDGGPAQVLASDAGVPGNLVLDFDRVMWVARSELHAVPKTGGAETVLARNLESVTMIQLDVKGGLAYGVDPGGGGFRTYFPGSLYKIPLDGGTATKWAEAQGEVGGFAVDATHVYWALYSSLSCQQGVGGVPGYILKMPLSGTEPSRIANAHQAGPLISDGANLYWFDLYRTDFSGGLHNTVRKFAK